MYFLDWAGEEEDKDDVNVWEDNWDDDNVDDDFSVQLRWENWNLITFRFREI